MGTLILRFARSMQDAVHKKPQPLGPLMPGDSHDRLTDCGAGGTKRERLPLLIPPSSLALMGRSAPSIYPQTLASVLCNTLALTLTNIAEEHLNI